MRQAAPPLQPFLAGSPEQLRLMSFGPRREIIAMLANDANLSARQLAERIRRPVTGLYRHLSLLQNAGLIYESGQRPGLKRPEALFSLTSRHFSAVEATNSPEGRAAMAQAASRYATATIRRLKRAIEAGAARFEGAEANAGFTAMDLQLDYAGLAEFGRLYREFVVKSRQLRVSNELGVETVTVTLLFAPDSETR